MKYAYEGSNSGYPLCDDDEQDAAIFAATAQPCDCCMEMFLPEDLTETEIGGVAVKLCENCINLEP